MAPTRLIPNRIACAAILTAALCAAMPAAAGDVQQIAIYGEVAPRCWVANPAQTTPNATAADRGAICNHSRPNLVSEVRTIGPDGALAPRISPAAASDEPSSQSARTALEIVVTPQL